MKLADMKVTEFAELLSSDTPAPGGGSAAALQGALGAALTAMVMSLTVGKKKYAEFEAEALKVQERANQIKAQFIDVMDRDTVVFGEVEAVFKMPKDTDEQKQSRKEAMQIALKNCTKTPFEMMALALQALEVTSTMVDKSNTSAASDLGVAALALKAAVQGAWLNVLINLGGIQDEGFVKTFRANGEALLAQALPLADEIHEKICAKL